MFMCRLFAISTKLSPEQKSSGIQVMETESFKLHCYQTPTGWFEVLQHCPEPISISCKLTFDRCCCILYYIDFSLMRSGKSQHLVTLTLLNIFLFQV